jgi:hypothetical protein
MEKESIDVPLFTVEQNTTTENALSIFDTVSLTETVTILPQEALDEIRIVAVDEIELRKDVVVVEVDTEFLEFCESVRRSGILEPIAVIALPNNLYRVESGNRRLRAAQHVGLSRIQVRVVQDPKSALNSEISSLYKLIESNIHRKKLSPLKLSEMILRIAILESGVDEATIRAAMNRESNAHRGSTRSTLDEQILADLHGVLKKIGISQNTYRTEYLPLVDLEEDLKIALQKNVPKTIVLELRKLSPDQREHILTTLYDDTQKMLSVRKAREMIRGPKTSTAETQFSRLAKKIDNHLKTLNGDYDHLYEIDFVFNALDLLVRSFETKMPYDWHQARTYSPGPDDV